MGRVGANSYQFMGKPFPRYPCIPKPLVDDSTSPFELGEDGDPNQKDNKALGERPRTASPRASEEAKGE